MWSLTTLTGLFYSLNQHYIAREAEEPAEGPVEPVEPVEPGEPVEPVEPVPPERGPVPQGRRSRPEQAGAAGAGRGSRGAGAGRGSRAAGRLAKKKKKKKLDRRFNRIYIRRRRKGERPSRDAAAKLCHKVWLFFDNLIKRRLCYGT